MIKINNVELWGHEDSHINVNGIPLEFVRVNGVVVWPDNAECECYVKKELKGYDSEGKPLYWVYIRGSRSFGYEKYTGSKDKSFDDITGCITGSIEDNEGVLRVYIEGVCKFPKGCRNMFYSCEKLEGIDLSSVDTSSVEDMGFMFTNCRSLQSAILPLNTSKVTDMNSMFAFCESLHGLDLSSFDTSKVENMNCMFDACKSLEELDLSSFDTSNVTSMYCMFGDLPIKHFNISNFDTRNVMDMGTMFSTCKCSSIDISCFDTRSVIDVEDMFLSSSQLEHIYVGDNWDISGAMLSEDMFKHCELLHNFSGITDKTKAIIDDGTNGGYLERKG